MRQLVVIAGFEKPEEKKAYAAPSIAFLGSVSELTAGGGPSDIWDITNSFTKVPKGTP